MQVQQLTQMQVQQLTQMQVQQLTSDAIVQYLKQINSDALYNN